MEGSKKIFNEGRIATIAAQAQDPAHFASLGGRKLADRVNIADVSVGKDKRWLEVYAQKHGGLTIYAQKHGVVVQDTKPKPDVTTPTPPIPRQAPNTPSGTKRSRIQNGFAQYFGFEASEAFLHLDAVHPTTPAINLLPSVTQPHKLPNHIYSQYLRFKFALVVAW